MFATEISEDTEVFCLFYWDCLFLLTVFFMWLYSVFMWENLVGIIATTDGTVFLGFFNL